MNLKIVALFGMLLISSCATKTSLNTMSQDWANLLRYQEENQKFLGANAPEVNAVFMGNSITEGWIREDPEFFSDNGYLSRGISGQTSPQMLLRFRQDVINLNPRLVVILAGTNDIAENTGPITLEEITENIKSMAELARANGIEVILCSVLPAADFPWTLNKNPWEKIPALNQMIKDYADNHYFRYADYFSVMVDNNNGLPKDLAEDGVHPNRAGYDIMKKLILETMQK